MKNESNIKPLFNLGSQFYPLTVCIFIGLIPFLPDEKLIRLKLQGFEMGVFALLIWVGVRYIIHIERRKFPFTILAWFCINLALWVIADQKSLATPELRRVFLATGSYLIFGLIPLDERWKTRVMMAWASAAGVLSIYGLLQWHGGLGPIAVPQFDRIMGTYGNPIFFAAFLLPSLFITTHLVIRFRNSNLSFLFLGFLVLELLALYFTKTRAAWIGVLCGIVFGVFIFRNKLKTPPWLWGIIFLGLIIFGVFTKNVWNRDQGHLLIWRDTVEMAMANPVFGVGLGAFHINFPEYAGDDLKSKWPQGKSIVNYAHNEYLQTFAETGLVGLLAFLAVIFWFFWDGHKKFEEAQSENDQFFLGFIFMGVVGLLVQNFFSADMRFSVSFASLFMLMGLAENVIARSGATKQSQTIVSPNRLPRALRALAMTIFISFMGLFVFPQLIKPYQAQRDMNSQVGFFDERLVNPATTIGTLETRVSENSHDIATLERLAFTYSKEIKSIDGKINTDMAGKAIDTYQKILKLKPAHLAAYNNLGNIYYTTGNVDAALGQWKKAIEVDSQFLDGYLNLGKVLFVQGELKQSAQYFEHALKIDPTNSDAQIYLRKMVE